MSTKVLYVKIDGKYRYQLRELIKDHNVGWDYYKELISRLNILNLDANNEEAIEVMNNWVLAHTDFVSEDEKDFCNETYDYVTMG